MRTTTIISSSLLAIVVSGAPVDLPKLAVGLPSLGLPSLPLPTGLPALTTKLPTFSTTLPAGIPTLPTGVPSLPVVPGKPTENVELPVENLPVKRADLPVVDSLLKDVKIPTIPKLPVGDLKLPVKRAELPVVDGVVEGVKIPSLVTLPNVPKLPVDNVNLPVKRADVVGDVLKDVTLIEGADTKVHLPLPINTGLVRKASEHAVNAPINVTLDDVIEVPTVTVPTVPGVGVPVVKDLLPVDLQSREIKQSLPVVGGVTVPLDAGKIQVGTADKYVEEVAKGTTVQDLPIEEVVKGTTIKDLPKVGSQPRQIKQSLPVVGGVDVPLDVGKIQVGTVDKYVEDVVKGTTGL